MPVVLGVAVWGHRWRSSTVRCWCDNAVVVAIIISGKRKMERVIHLMWSLFFFLAKWELVLECHHLPGVENGTADALSRDNLPSFQKLVPNARREPLVIPDTLL